MAFDPTTATLLEDEPDTGFDPASATLVEDPVEQDVPRGTEVPQTPKAARPDARADLTKRLQDAGLFGSATAALQGASDKGIRRKEDGDWDLPLMEAQVKGDFLDEFTGAISQGATALRQKLGSRMDDVPDNGVIDKKATQKIFHDFQQANNLSDDEVAAVWSDLGNQNRTWAKDETVRTLSDGELLPNPGSPVWLNPDTAKAAIEATDTTPEIKAAALSQIPQLATEIAAQKTAAYEAAAEASNTGQRAGVLGVAQLFADRVVPPSEWAAKTGRTDVGSPQFVLDYEKTVDPGFLEGIAGKVVLSGNKLATQTLGTLGAMGITSAGDAAAESSATAATINQGLPDTGLAGAAVEELLPIGAQILTGRGFAAFGKTAAALGTFATAGTQSAGLTFAEERANGATEEEAREKAVKAGLSTAIITSMFGTGAGGGVERFAAGQAADDVTVRALLQMARDRGIREVAKSPELRKFAGTVAASTIGEGAEEGIDQLLGAFLQADPDTSLADAWEQATQAFKVGAAIGGGVDVAMNIVQHAPRTAAALAETPAETVTEAFEPVEIVTDEEGSQAPVGIDPGSAILGTPTTQDGVLPEVQTAAPAAGTESDLGSNRGVPPEVAGQITPGPTTGAEIPASEGVEPITPSPDSDPTLYSRDRLKDTFDLTDEQADVTDALVQSMGLDTSRIRLTRGGTPGQGLSMEGEASVPQGIKGSFEVLENGDMLLRGLTNPDVSTGLHELSHVARRTLFDKTAPPAGMTVEDIEVAERWAGAEDGVWTKNAEEKFARGFERYLRDGKAPDSRLAKVFAKIENWLKGIYESLAGSPVNVRVTPEMRAVFDRLVTRNLDAGIPATADGLTSSKVIPEVIENAPASDTVAKEAPAEIPAATEEPVLADAEESPPPETPTPLEPESSAPDFDAPYDPEAPTGLKHAITDADRARYGLPPRGVAPATTNQVSWDRALAAEQAHRAAGKPGTAGGDLLNSLLQNAPRALTPDEHALLLHEKIRRQQVVDAAYSTLNALPQTLTEGDRKNAQAAMVSAQEDFDNLLVYADAAGSASGLSLQARKMLVHQDYSLATVLNRALAAKNKHSEKPQKLTEKERQQAIDLALKLQKAQERADSLEAENKELGGMIDRLTKEVEDAQKKLRAKGRDPKSRARIKEKLQPKIDEAKARLAEKGKFKFLAQEELSPEDSQDVEDLATVASEWLVDRELSLPDFTSRLIDTFGDFAEPLAGHVFNKANEIYLEASESLESGTATRNPSRQEVLDGITPEGDTPSREDIWALARAHVVAGLRGNKVLNAVFDDLAPLFPGLTREQVATDFTGYGKVTLPSDKEVPKELNRIRSLERIALKILDVKSGKPPKKTGSQRGEQDVEIRELEKEFRKLLKESGIRVTDPARQIKSTLGAIKRRMQNEIEELQRALDSGKRRAENSPVPVEYDEEAETLKEQLDQLRKDYEEAFGDKKLSEEDRIKIAEKSLERRIKTAEELKAAGLTSRPRTTFSSAWSPNISDLNARLKGIQDARKEMARESGATDAARLARQLASIKNRKVELERRMREKDFSPKAKPTPLKNSELVKARFELEKLKAAYNEMLIEHAITNANFSKKLAYNIRSGGNLLKVTTLGGDFGVLFRNLGGATMASITEDMKKLLPGARGAEARANESAFLSMLKQGARAFGSAEYEAALFDEIMHRPNAAYDQAYGLKFASPFDSARISTEDIPAANLLDKIPWWIWPTLAGAKIAWIASNPVLAAAVGLSGAKIAGLLGVSVAQKPLLQALDRAQRAMTNHARATLMDAMIASMPDETVSMDDGKALAKAVMIGTGRGAVRSLESFMPALQTMTLAMRFYLSRVQALSVYPLWSGPMSADARKQIAGFYGKSVTGRAAIYALLALAFGKADDDDPEDTGVVLNPWSKDFGKVRISKNLMVDVGSGLQQFAGAFYRSVRGGVQDREAGEIKVYTPQEKANDMLRFLGTKRALTVGFLWDTWKGEYYGGKPRTIVTALDEVTSMIILNDMYQVYEEGGPVGGTLAAILMMAGGGVTVGSFEEEKAKWAALRNEKEIERQERGERLNQ